MMGGAQQACYPLPGAAPAGARMPLAGNWAAAMQGLAPPPSAWYGGMPQGMPPQGSAMHGLPPGLMAPGGAYSMPFAALSNNLPGAAMGYAMDLDAAQVRAPPLLACLRYFFRAGPPSAARRCA